MSIDRLRSHFGFGRMPFGKDLAPGMLHSHRAHAEAVARIGWCISEQQVGVITGECGAGKTVAARAAVSALDASRHTVLYLGTPGVGLRGIYATIVTGLGGRPRFHCAALIPQAQELLAAETAERGKQVLLVCDEAHLLDADCLEGIRCLSNASMDRTAPFCLLLLGQPTLRRRLRLGAFGCCSASRRCAAGCGWARSPRWTSASGCATRSPVSIRPRRQATSLTISRSPGARTRCSATTRSRSSTRSAAACHGRSTTSPSRR